MIYRKKVEGFQERDNFPLTPLDPFQRTEQRTFAE